VRDLIVEVGPINHLGRADPVPTARRNEARHRDLVLEKAGPVAELVEAHLVVGTLVVGEAGGSRSGLFAGGLARLARSVARRGLAGIVWP